MALSPSVSRKLRETLGDEAGGDLVTWLDEERQERLQLRQQVAAMEMRLTALIGDVKSDLMKWSFVFWCGAVAAVAALAGVFRS